MKHLLLERKPTTHTETEGFLSFGKIILATIERPWIEADTPGGKPYESCVPDGMYTLRPHIRPDPNPDDDKPGQSVVALINPALGVYYLKKTNNPAPLIHILFLHSEVILQHFLSPLNQTSPIAFGAFVPPIF